MQGVNLMDGTHGEMKPTGNTRLIDYGILNEKSDLRAHVCVLGKNVYVFPTASGIDAIMTGKYSSRNVFTKNIKTATGYLVPPNDIENCEVYEIPDKWWRKVSFCETDTTTQKGDKAIRIVKNMIIRGMMPALKLNFKEITEKDLQIEGTDIIIHAKARIQVKCDYRGGKGGTGNLFLQIQECNPFKNH